MGRCRRRKLKRCSGRAWRWSKVAVPDALKRPPTYRALLPDRVLLLTFRMPPLAMPPPSLAELADSVLSLTVRLPRFHRPAPYWAELPSSVLLLTVSVPTAVLTMPPPW